MIDEKKMFPIFTHHPNLVYLDNAASTQMPQAVIDAVDAYYESYKANVHRGAYLLSGRATDAYEASRETIAGFIGADADEIIFTSGTTMALNMLAQMLMEEIESGDNIVITRLEHHANLIPWQQIARKKNVELRFIELTDDFQIDLDSANALIDEHTKVLSIAHVSNSIGTITPLEQLVPLFREKSSGCIAVDGCQAVAHMPVNVKDLGIDFYAFSGHKMYGPTGIGVLYGRKKHLEKFEPVVFGGDMVDDVSDSDATWKISPQRFEAGTPNIAGSIGLAEAVRFIESIGYDLIEKQEKELKDYLFDQLDDIVEIIGPKKEGGSIASFVIERIHPYDIATILDQQGIAVRSGNHCTIPLMKHLNLVGTCRASIALYNTREDVDQLVEGIKKAKDILIN